MNHTNPFFTRRLRPAAPFQVILLFIAGFMAVSFVVRTVLLAVSFSSLDLTPGRLLGIYGVGLVFDLVTALYFCLPFIFYLMLMPRIILRSRIQRWLVQAGLFLITFVVLFSGTAEYFFFEEFGTRFNFIAVDYLIYTREVVRNIVESYPLTPLLLAILTLTAILVIAAHPFVRQAFREPAPYRHRLATGFALLFLTVLGYTFLTVDASRISSNNYVNALASNGIYDFIAAFRNNQLNYGDFYPVLDNRTVFNRLRKLVKDSDSRFTDPDSPDPLRHITEEGPEQHLNLVFVVEESLSADFMKHFGNPDNLTPRLDTLADHSLFFTRLYATGTRTARGLEAITLSVPPTPGRSIVKRPCCGHLFSLSSVLKPRGYDMIFLYGGYGYFDNMNAFFTRNGFRKVDRADLSDGEITFENAWGVCDEDMFRRSLAEFDRTARSGRPFCAIIMTTSNHRPYTYPDGRVPIPSHSGRKGAVQYADYATGKFLEDARSHDWFRDTIFVIVADHCASAMGKRAIPVNRYHIPLMVYSPAHISPGVVDTLCSQMDITPTVLDLMNIAYDSRFFGRDVLDMKPEEGRALLGTYSRLGLFRHNRLVILDVHRREHFYTIDPLSHTTTPAAPDLDLLEDAIAYYQGAWLLTSEPAPGIRARR